MAVVMGSDSGGMRRIRHRLREHRLVFTVEEGKVTEFLFNFTEQDLDDERDLILEVAKVAQANEGNGIYTYIKGSHKANYASEPKGTASPCWMEDPILKVLDTWMESDQDDEEATLEVLPCEEVTAP